LDEEKINIQMEKNIFMEEEEEEEEKEISRQGRINVVWHLYLR
jgi:hypothetical protein